MSVEFDISSIDTTTSSIDASVSGIEAMTERQTREIVEIARDTGKLYAIESHLGTIKIELFLVILLLVLILFNSYYKKK